MEPGPHGIAQRSEKEGEPYGFVVVSQLAGIVIAPDTNKLDFLRCGRLE